MQDFEWLHIACGEVADDVAADSQGEVVDLFRTTQVRMIGTDAKGEIVTDPM